VLSFPHFTTIPTLQVVDSSPHPGLRVFPENGVVPTGGAACLKVLLCPEAVGNIDIRVCVALREGKTISFRLAGMVEQPTLSIDQVYSTDNGFHVMLTMSTGVVQVW